VVQQGSQRGSGILLFENKLALVTGSTAGIGFAIAKALAAEARSRHLNRNFQHSMEHT